MVDSLPSHSQFSHLWRRWILPMLTRTRSEQRPGLYSRIFQGPLHIRTERLLWDRKNSPRRLPHLWNGPYWWARIRLPKERPPFSTIQHPLRLWIISDATSTLNSTSVRLRIPLRRSFGRSSRAGTRRKATTLGQTSQAAQPIERSSNPVSVKACLNFLHKFTRHCVATKDTPNSTEWCMKRLHRSHKSYSIMRQWAIKNPAFNKVILISDIITIINTLLLRA